MSFCRLSMLLTNQTTRLHPSGLSELRKATARMGRDPESQVGWRQPGGEESKPSPRLPPDGEIGARSRVLSRGRAAEEEDPFLGHLGPRPSPVRRSVDRHTTAGSGSGADGS
jgi:hypothetical protein